MATSAFDFEITSSVKGKYKVEVRHRPAVLDNMKHWQVFENDKQLEIFFPMKEEFAKMKEERDGRWEEVDKESFINQLKEELYKEGTELKILQL